MRAACEQAPGLASQFDGAISDYDEAIRLKPVSTQAYYNRGYTRQAKGDNDGAISDYTEVIRLDPTFADVYCSRGNALYSKRDYDKALGDYDEAIRLDPKNALDRVCRANAYYVVGSYDSAVADYEEAIRLGSKDPAAFDLLASIRATCTDPKLRDGKEAVEAATRAYVLSGGEVPKYLATLAAAYAESGDFEKAVRWQEEANRRFADEEQAKGVRRLSLYKNKAPFRESSRAPVD